MKLGVVTVLLVVSLQEVTMTTLLNVASKTLGATCKPSSSESSSYSCNNVLQSSSFWTTKRSSDCKYHSPFFINVTFGATVDVIEVGIRQNTWININVNIIEYFVATYGNSATGSRIVYVYDFDSANQSMQKFRITDFKKDTILKEINWVEIKFFLSLKTVDCGSTQAGFDELNVGAVYNTVYTENGDACVFPFTKDGNTYTECMQAENGFHICNTTTGHIGRCMLPVVNGCDQVGNSTPNIGPPGVTELWCKGQGGCYRSSDNTCKRSTHHCLPDRFGPNCEHRCNCNNPLQGCDIVTGRKDSCICKDGHYPVGDACQAETVPTVQITNEPANPETTSLVVCKSRAIPPATTELHSVGAKKTITVAETGVTNENETITKYTVHNVKQGDEFICIAKNGKGEKTHRYTAYMYSLARLSFAPEASLNLVNSHVLTIMWLPFTENLTGSGDGLVIQYIVMMKNSLDTEDAWSDLANIDAGLTNETLYYYKYQVAGLKPERQYHFSIACVRVGEGGRGPPSPILSIWMPNMAGMVTEAPIRMYLLITTAVLGVLVLALMVAVIMLCCRNQAKVKRQTDDKVLQKAEIALQDVEVEPKEPASDEYMELAQCDLQHTYDN